MGRSARNAILALSQGAKLGGFAHNTGEGGISPYHLEGGADLIWQVGTGYFGCRTDNGDFCPKLFEEKSKQPNVKMIELKLSQGAKPGHGGILPAAKTDAGDRQDPSRPARPRRQLTSRTPRLFHADWVA